MAVFLALTSFKNKMEENINPRDSKHILFCYCGGERIHPELLNAVDEYLKENQVDVTRLSDLCGLAAKNMELLRGLFKAGAEYLVIGCYPRTINLLLDQIKEQAGKPEVLSYINLIDLTPGEAIDRINRFCGNYPGNAVQREITESSGWPSWYPVIDYSRCTACGQCADFCLFGVYEKTENRVNVVNPAGCKINCPACARICASTAIIFPKYKNGGAIGGSDEIDEQAEQQRQAQDMENILGNDLYIALEQRKARRKSIIREEAMNRAMSERDNAINIDLKN
jgi:NAD-dependent dihydropyrimidine dehydrogenase PreA subunit